MRHLRSSKSPASFSPTIPYPGVPLPPLGPSGQFPSFLGTVGRSDFLPSIPLHFVSFVPRYRRDALASLQRLTDIGVRWPGLFSRSPTTGSFRRRRQDLPGSLTNPDACMPLFLDPGGAVQPSQNDRTMLPSAVSTASASSMWSFRGSIAAAYPLAVYASQRRLPGTTQDSLPAGGSSLCRAGFNCGYSPPRRVRSGRFQSRCLVGNTSCFPLPRAFPGAMRPAPLLRVPCCKPPRRILGT